jgi:hypothetical protein
MLNAFKQIPAPLQKQILHRLGYGVVLLFVTIILFFYTIELFSVLACVFAMIFFVFSSFSLFRRAVIGDYVIISGECLSVILAAVKRSIKTIIIRTDDNRILKITIKHKIKKIEAGTKIIVYVASNMPVYEDGDVYLFNSYLALDIKNEYKNN